MEAPVLSNKVQFPTEEIIFSHIGKSKRLWELLFEFIHKNQPDFLEEWKFYNDGKSWLLKVTRKKKTILWLSIIRGTFRTTYYFTDKADGTIYKSHISEELKKQFKNKKGNKLKGITIVFKTKKDVEYARELLTIKLNIK